MKKLMLCLLSTCMMLCILTAVQAEDVSLYLSRDSLTISVGRYVTVYAYVSPAGAMRDDVTFSTSDAAIASVDRDGKVKALKAGECKLTATSTVDKTISVTIPVRVIVPVKSIHITADDNSLMIGTTLQLSTDINPADASIQTVTYASGDENTATVSEAGVVTGIARGEVTITAKSGDDRATDGIRITVKQQPNSVTVTPETVSVAKGRTQRLQPTVLPNNANDKTVLWTSADESVATVSNRGVVTGVELGKTVITATCRDNADATCDIPVSVVKLATGVAFHQDIYSLMLGNTVQLGYTVSPSDTSDPSVTFKVENPNIASVNENGVLTALEKGHTTVIVTTADGSRKSARAKVRVLVPLTGVHYPHTDIRVGEDHYGHFTVDLEPSEYVNNSMSWVTGDSSVATVTGDTNTFKLVGGKNWGRTTVTGTTEDGGFNITLNANIGSLNNAVTVERLEIRDGKPYITLVNRSGIEITQVQYYMQGLDSNQQHINMSRTGDLLTLYGTYDPPLQPGERTEHGRFSFHDPSDYPGLAYLCIVVTGWKTSTGYYDSDGTLRYEYAIPAGRQRLVVYPSGTDPSIFQ